MADAGESLNAGNRSRNHKRRIKKWLLLYYRSSGNILEVYSFVEYLMKSMRQFILQEAIYVGAQHCTEQRDDYNGETGANLGK